MSGQKHRAKLRGTATHLLALCKRNNEIRDESRRRGVYWAVQMDWVNLAGEHCRTNGSRIINFYERGKREEERYGS